MTRYASNYKLTIHSNSFSAPESPPMITFIDNSDPYSIVVYWNPPMRPNGVITRYTLYIGYETQSGEINVFNTDGQSTSYNVSNLLPYQEISIEVTASTRIGEGPSSVHETRTAQARMLVTIITRNLIIYLLVHAAPQEVTEVVVDVISDSRIQVQWGPPVRSNGILTYYSIAVLNQQTGFNFSSQINALAAEVITVSGLSMLNIQTKGSALIIIIISAFFRCFCSLYCTSICSNRGWKRKFSHFSHLHKTWR